MTGLLITLDAVGGVWQYAMDLGRIAAQAGFRPVFAGQGPTPSVAQRAEAEEIGPLEWGDAPLDWMVLRPEALTPVGPWIDDLARRHGIGLLHLNLPSQAIGLRSGLPVVVACHSCLTTWFLAVRSADLPADLAWHRDLTAKGCQAATVVVAPSASHAALMHEAYGLGDVVVVHNASHSPLRPRTPGNCIVAAGRWWDEGKNAAVLDAAAGLSGLPVTMIGPTAGPGGAVVTIQHAASLGSRPYDETLERLAGAAIFVSPSRYEPFGLAALEAARASRPLVLADVPTYRELWDEAALFFPPDDPEALARALAGLSAAPEWRRRLGTAAQRRAQSYTPDVQRAAMTRVWHQALLARSEAA